MTPVGSCEDPPQQGHRVCPVAAGATRVLRQQLADLRVSFLLSDASWHQPQPTDILLVLVVVTSHSPPYRSECPRPRTPRPPPPMLSPSSPRKGHGHWHTSCPWWWGTRADPCLQALLPRMAPPPPFGAGSPGADAEAGLPTTAISGGAARNRTGTKTRLSNGGTLGEAPETCLRLAPRWQCRSVTGCDQAPVTSLPSEAPASQCHGHLCIDAVSRNPAKGLIRPPPPPRLVTECA